MMTITHWKGFAATAAVMLALVAGPAVAEEAPLERGEVERYVDSMHALQDFARKYEDVDDDITPEEATALQQEHASVLEEHGFAQDEWMATHQRVLEAVMAINMSQEMDEQDLEAQIDAQREQILANEDIPEEQREAMLEQIEQQRQMFADLQDNPDIDAVEPYYEELRDLFEGGL